MLPPMTSQTKEIRP